MNSTITLITPSGEHITVTPDDNSCRVKSLDGSDTLKVCYSLKEPKEVPIGTTAVYRGDTYTLESQSDLQMMHTELYNYALKLTAPSGRLANYIVANQVDGRTDFPLTATPAEHLQLIIDNLNSRESGWSIGDIITDEATKLIHYTNTNCRSALEQIAQEFHTELYIDGKVISIATNDQFKSDALPLRYGQGNGLLSDIKRVTDNEPPISTLYVVSSDRNIDPAKYGAKTLRMPKGLISGEFVTNSRGTSVRFKDAPKGSPEGVAELTQIYPSRVGVVSKAESPKEGLFDFLDNSIPDTLDFKKATIPGQSITIIFQTGMLAGRELEANYVHKDRRFQIVPKEEDGITLPGGVFVPKVGDKYAVFNCELPDEYTKQAERNLLNKAIELLKERNQQKVTIVAQVDSLFAKKRWNEIEHKLKVGRWVSFTDPKWNPTPTLIQIQSVTEWLTNPYSPKIELSNTPTRGGKVTELIKEVMQSEVKRREQKEALMKLQDRTYKDTQAVREMVERLKLEGFSQALKPETLQTMYAVIGSPALQFEFKDGAFAWSEGKGGAVTIPRQVIRRRVPGTTLEPEPKTVETTIPALTYTLKAEDRQAYIYTELKPTPRYVVSTKPLVTPDRLLVGLLHGTEGSRDFTPLYGFTEISPSHIATKLIRSRTGNMLIDLETGTIYSDSIEFRRPDGRRTNLKEAIDTIQKTPGPKGDKGEDGKDGLPGAPGKDAQNVRPNILRARDIVNRGGLTYDEQKKAYIIHPHDKGWMILGASNGDIIAGKSLVYSYTLRNKSDVGYDVAHPFNRRADGRSLNDLIKPGEIVRIYMHRTDNYSNFILNNDKAFAPTKGYIEVSEFKVEEVEDGGLPIPTAYLPHPDDLIGKDGAGVRTNLVDLFSFLSGFYDINNGYTFTDLSAIERATNFIDILGEDKLVIKQSPVKSMAQSKERTRLFFYDRDKKYIGNYLYCSDSWSNVNTTTTVPSNARYMRMTRFVNSKPEIYIQIKGEPGKDGKDAIVSKEIEIDTSGLDQDTYYPITITGAPSGIHNRYRVYAKLYYSNKPNWAIHSGGFQCELVWRCFDSEWGAYDVNMQVEVSSWRLTKKNVPPISQPFQVAEYSVNYTRVRGGGKYYVEVQAREQAALDKIKVELVTAKKSYGRAPYTRYLEPEKNATAPITEIDKEAKARAAAVQEVKSGLSNANTAIATLDKISKELQSGKLDASKFADIRYLLDALQKGTTQVAGGLILSKIIALSNQVDRITAYISGYDGKGDGKILRAGIKYDTSGADTGDEEMNLKHNGEAKLGAWTVQGDSISNNPAPDQYRVRLDARQGELSIDRGRGSNQGAYIGKDGVSSNRARCPIYPPSVGSTGGAAIAGDVQFTDGDGRRPTAGFSLNNTLEREEQYMKDEVIFAKYAGVAGTTSEYANPKYFRNYGGYFEHLRVDGLELMVRTIWEADTPIQVRSIDCRLLLVSPKNPEVRLPRADDVYPGWTLDVSWNNSSRWLGLETTDGTAMVRQKDMGVTRTEFAEKAAGTFRVTRIRRTHSVEGKLIAWYVEFISWIK